MALSNAHICTSCVHPRWKPNSNSILLFGMWHRIHFIRLTHMDSHLGIEMPQSFTFISWHAHWFNSTFLWEERVVLLQNTSRNLLLSKEAFLWNPLRPVTTARTSNQVVLFCSLDNTCYWSSRLIYLNKKSWWFDLIWKYSGYCRTQQQKTRFDYLYWSVCDILGYKQSIRRCSGNYSYRQDLFDRSRNWSGCPICYHLGQ